MLTRKLPPGVIVEGPVVDAKFRDSYIAFGIMIARFDRRAGLGIHARHRLDGDFGLRRHVLC